MTALSLNEYQARARSTAIYPGQDSDSGIVYCVLGVNGEAGEVAEVLKKRYRDGETAGFVDAMVKEGGDVLWYLANLCTELGLTLEDLAEINLDKLSQRADMHTLRGSGDDR